MNDVEAQLLLTMTLGSMLLEVSAAAVVVIDEMSKELKAHDIAISLDIKADVALLFASVEQAKVYMKSILDLEKVEADVR